MNKLHPRHRKLLAKLLPVILAKGLVSEDLLYAKNPAISPDKFNELATALWDCAAPENTETRNEEFITLRAQFLIHGSIIELHTMVGQGSVTTLARAIKKRPDLYTNLDTKTDPEKLVEQFKAGKREPNTADDSYYVAIHLLGQLKATQQKLEKLQNTIQNALANSRP